MKNCIGIDVGTGNIVVAKTDGKDIITESMRNMFYPLEEDTLKTSLFSPDKSDYIELKNNKGETEKVVLVGQDAYDLCNAVNAEVYRPMKKGVISSSEIDNLEVIALMFEKLVGGKVDDGYCVYSVPAQPIDVEAGSVLWHEKVFEKIFKNLGYKTKAMNEGMSVVFSELAKENFTGIGISCVTPDTLIVSDRGYIPIADITTEDRVLTKSGRFERVLNKIISKRKENIREISYFSYNKPLRITSEHLVYIKRDGEEMWVEAKDVAVGDWVMTPSIKYNEKIKIINYSKRTTNSLKKTKIHIEMSEVNSKLVGLFLGDGHTTKLTRGVSFDFGNNEQHLIEFVEYIGKKSFKSNCYIRNKDTSNATRVTLYNTPLKEWFTTICYDSNKMKTLPWKLDEFNRGMRLGLLQGLLESDGHIGEEQISFENTNPYLAMLVQQLCLSEGFTGSLHIRQRDPECHEGFDGRKIISMKPTYTFIVNQQFVPSLKYLISTERHSTRIFQENTQWNKVTSNDEVFYDGDVYDLTIENDHTFCVPGCCIHNCGAGLTNVALAFNGIPIITFSVGRGGDWIDERVAENQGIKPNKVTKVKEKEDFDLMNPSNSGKKQEQRIRENLSVYYENLINYVIKVFIKEFQKKADGVDLDNEITIVVSGGTSKPKGFLELFKQVFDESKDDFPFDVKEIRAASDPLDAVAKGNLIFGIWEQKNSSSPDSKTKKEKE